MIKSVYIFSSFFVLPCSCSQFCKRIKCSSNPGPPGTFIHADERQKPGEKSYERKGPCNYQLKLLNVNVSTCSTSDPLKYTHFYLGLDIASSSLFQSKLSEISEGGSQAERKQEVFELHNEVLQ